jgi:GTPase SAR1 family protein
MDKSSEAPTPIMKVVFLGDTGVGKTSLINAIVGRPFANNTKLTTSVQN